MDEFDQVENKRDFRKMIFIIIGVVVVAGAVTAFLLLKKDSRDAFNSDAQNANAPSVQTVKEKPLFSQDTSTWKNYFWPGKVNMHYPDGWQFEEIAKNDSIIGLEIAPPTGIVDDIIFVGGDSIKCSDILKYSKNKCLKNDIQVPFYTNSKNEEVLNAFDLIYQNSVLIEEEK